ncbi:prepilin-type N-terminal cleavage/methylation domain-containing protein [Caldicoprobacter guelmensis]|uniref:PilW family protein n=1 Tax=Caldicoprobacter guelmensis TaxID=1170224 RepID=UPI00195DA16D|nr:prepilin-type N-terminal cleavage/methylation domain-containing protein [Caldicoprobacter guelmensis]MBM7581270.1 prepilin-type N-terminal cleavage/methylation domain-containing protein [Caldicoprobacter guelmensis]
MSKIGKRGYTLVEVMIAVALLAVVVGVGYAIYVMGFRAYIMATRRMEVQQNVRSAASYIQKRLLTAGAGDVEERYVNGLKTLKIGNECFNLKESTLRVNLDCANPTSTPNPLAEGITYFDFVIDGKQIKVELAGGQEGEDDYFKVEFEVLLRR